MNPLICLYSNITNIIIKGINFNPRSQRLRCFGHIINLVVKAFSYGKDPIADNSINPDTMLKDLDIDNAILRGMSDVEQVLYWRKRGPYGRLRNIITYICWTPQRRQEFAALTREHCPDIKVFAPIAANTTRWNGDFRAIRRALELRFSLETYAA